MMVVIQSKTTAIWQYMEHVYTPLMEPGLNAQTARGGATASVWECHNMLLKEHNSLAAIQKIVQVLCGLLKTLHVTYSCVRVYTHVDAFIVMRTTTADYICAQSAELAISRSKRACLFAVT